MMRKASLTAIKAGATGLDWLRPSARGVVILLYHRVGGGSGQEMDLSLGLFSEQMEVLARERRTVTLDGALDLLVASGPSRAPDPVVVTFDDGTADFVAHALPILVDLGIPACLYLATDFVESGRPFPFDGTPLTWGALREALSTGLVTVGSHTHRHALMDRLSPGAAAEELDRSIELIEDRLGVEVRHFAYPKAVATSAAIEAEVRSRFASGALGGNRVNPYGRTDPHRLGRTPIQSSDGMRWFLRKKDGGLALEGSIRERLNRRRYRRAAT